MQEAIERAEARKAITQWEQPTITTSVSEATFNMVRDNPGKTKTQIVDLLAVSGYKTTSTTSLLSIMTRYGIITYNEDKTLRAVSDKYKSRAEFADTKKRKVTRIIRRPDAVNHPEHYKVGGIETIDFIEAKQLNYNLGNVVKYITRADHKGNQLQDLQKAQWYLAREIERVQS